jgi:hypothetical protein
MRSAPSQNYKLAKLTSDHRELLEHYNLLYNIATEMHRQLTHASTNVTEPLPIGAAQESDSYDEEGTAKVKTKDEDKSRKRKPSEERD